MKHRIKIDPEAVRAAIGDLATVTVGANDSVRVNTGAPAHSVADARGVHRPGRLRGGALWREREREKVSAALAAAGLGVTWQSSRSGVVVTGAA